MRANHDQGWHPPHDGANLRAAGATAVRGAAVCGRETNGAPGKDQRPFWMKSFDVLAVSTLLVLLLIAAQRLVSSVAAGGPLWLLPPMLVAAVLCADLVSGLVHWIGDRFFAETTPILGAMLIRPFREHHREPLAITRHGFFELCGNNALIVVPVVALSLLGPAPGDGLIAFAGNAFVIFFALAVFVTNQVHKWAHARHIMPPVRWLQASGLILSPARHARHHRGDFSQAYCVTTGWLNPALDAARLLPRCERALRRMLERCLAERSSRGSRIAAR